MQHNGPKDVGLRVGVLVQFTERFDLLRAAGHEDLIVGVESDISIGDVPAAAAATFERDDRDVVPRAQTTPR